MPRYMVPIKTTITATPVIFADNPEEAKEIALEEHPQSDIAYSGFDSEDEWENDGEPEETDREISHWVSDENREREEEDE